MINNLTIPIDLLILGGAVIMLFAAIRTARILKLTQAKRYSRYWKLCLMLMIFFLPAYLTTAYLFNSGMEKYGTLITGLVFFFGSLFVYLFVLTGQLTFTDIRKSEEELESKVNQRTAELRKESADRAKADELLKQSEMHFRSLTENSPFLIMQIDKDAKIKYLNRVVRPYTPEKMIGLPVYDFIHPDSKKAYEENLANVFSKGQIAQFETRGKRENEEMGWHFSSIAPVIGKSGIDEAIIFTLDITERKKVEERLAETTVLLQTTFDLTVEGILAVNKEGKFITFNKRFSEMWRIPKVILDTKDDNKALDFVLSQLKDPDQFIGKVKELYSKPDQESFDVLEFKDGRIFERYSMPEKRNGEIFGRVWNFIDVTERKKYEKEIALSNQRFTQIFNLSPVAIAISGFEKGEFLYVNKKFCELTGYKTEELIGNSSTGLNIISAEERKKITKHTETYGYTKEIETKIRGKNGDIMDILLSSEKIEIDNSICLVKALVNITQQKNIEKQIAASEKRFTQIFNFSPVAISISTLEDGQFIYVNDAFCKTLGFTKEELIGKRSVELNILDPDQRKEIKEQTLSSGGRIKDFETIARKKNGEIIDVLYSVEKIEMDGKICVATAFVNITELKNSEQRTNMILENIGEGVIVTDPQKRVLLSNHLADEILEINNAHYSSRWINRYDIFYPDGHTVFPVQNFPLEKALRGGVTSDAEIVLFDPGTNKHKLLRVSGHPIVTEDNRLIAAVTTLKDITELRETEKALQESESKYRKLIGFKRDGHDKEL
ncbi:MAG: PAS domain S-box protein [Bacteroidia bacterium]